MFLNIDIRHIFVYILIKHYESCSNGIFSEFLQVLKLSCKNTISLCCLLNLNTFVKYIIKIHFRIDKMGKRIYVFYKHDYQILKRYSFTNSILFLFDVI